MKKVIKSIVGISFLMICLGMSVIAAPRDSGDRYFTDFTISPRDYAMPTVAYGSKDDSTSVYVYLTDATDYRYNYVKVRTYGPGKINLTCDSSGERQDHVSCYIGQEHEVYNTIWESGYRAANIGLCSANYINTQTVSGRWSPDTVGHFPVAN